MELLLEDLEEEFLHLITALQVEDLEVAVLLHQVMELQVADLVVEVVLLHQATELLVLDLRV
jgi:hypothetical protein